MLNHSIDVSSVNMRLFNSFFIALTGLAMCMTAYSAAAQESANHNQFALDLEAGAVGFSRNDVRIPEDTGTEFDMLDLIGDGPKFLFRLSGDWDINSRHGLRLVIAPFEVSGTGELSRQTSFAGELFSAATTNGTTVIKFYITLQT